MTLFSFSQKSFALLPLGVALLSLGRPASADVTLPPVLTGSMVLQREMPVPIWGKAEPGERVTVRFRDQTISATADAQGQWLVKLDPLKPGEPAALIVAGHNTITIPDVLVGEVWLGSGQSNLDTPVQVYLGDDPVLRDAAKQSYPNLRLFRSKQPERGWQPAKPDPIAGFSAQLFYFGLKLQRELGVPVGLMEAAVAGSPSGPFLPQTAFDADPAIQKAAAAADLREPLAKRQEQYQAAYAKWEQETSAARAAGTAEEKLPHPPRVPVAYAAQKTGATFEKLVRPLVPYAMRGVLWDQGEGGAVEGPIWQPMVTAALIRSWRELWGQGKFPWITVQKPSGGGCALRPDDPVNRGAMPFVAQPKDPPPSEYFSSLRQDGYRIMRNPRTFLVINSDLAPGLHPANKSGYGTRDCQVALGAVYGRPVGIYGPVFAALKSEEGRLRISYTHLGRGLTVPAGQPLQGFQVAGEDHEFRWADAAIDGATVVLSSPEVPHPVAARYGWTWPLAWANLFNADGLPALGFSTEQEP